MHCKQVWLLHISELWWHSPTALSLAHNLHLAVAVAAEAQRVLLLQQAQLASFGL